MEKKNPAEQVCFYCKQGRTGHIDEAMAGSSSFECFLFNQRMQLHAPSIHGGPFAETRSCDRACDTPCV